MKEGTPGSVVWQRFAGVFLGVLLGGLGAIYLFLLVIDPYDTGRFPTFMSPGVADEGARTAGASHGRDSRFDAAIFGNSRGFLLDPEKLSQMTGLSFVQMTTPGSGPKEQMTLMRYFMAHHARIDTMVLNVDERWCGHDPSLPVIFAFPFWLYGSDFDYLAHLLSTRAITAARSRIELALGLRPAADPRGYTDYETGRTRNFHPGPFVERSGEIAPLRTADTYFPAIDALDEVLAALPASTGIVIVAPPVYREKLPIPGTQIAADLPECKAALSRRVEGRSRSAFLDYLVDGPISRDPENFMDLEHYRMNIARIIEARIAEVVEARGRSASQ